MNREDIIRMAREAGIEHLPDNWGDGWWQADNTQSLERFAQAAYAAGAAAEREAVLDLLDAYAKNNTDLRDAIRTRGNT